MKFTVINIYGDTVFSTDCISCIPTQDEIKSMTDVGYTFTIDKKQVSLKDINKYIKEHKKG